MGLTKASSGKLWCRPMLPADKFRTTEDQYERSRLLAATIIRDQDPDFCELIAQTTFVSAYKFDEKTSEWTRADVEGFLFLTRRRSHPKYRLMILNQRNPTNLIEEIDETWDLSSENHYIFYRYRASGKLMTRGLWFFDEGECSRIRNHLERVLSDIKTGAGSLVPPTTITNEMVTSLLRRIINQFSKEEMDIRPPF